MQYCSLCFLDDIFFGILTYDETCVCFHKNQHILSKAYNLGLYYNFCKVQYYHSLYLVHCNIDLFF